MAWVRKRKRKMPDGTTQDYGRWLVIFRDHLDIKREAAAYSDKKASEAMGRRLDRLAAKRSIGEPLGASEMHWLETLEPSLLERLIDWGVLDLNQAASLKDLHMHVEEFGQCLSEQGRTEIHRKTQISRIKKLIEAVGATRWNELDGEEIQGVLAQWRNSGMSISSSNHYLTAIKTFANWMMKTRRTQNNPVAHISRLNADTDKRRRRRALTADECARLIEAAKQGSKIYGMTGAERALLYRLALDTGMRWSELRSLKRASFDLKSKQPTVIVEAAYSKHRKEDVIILRAGLAPALEKHLDAKEEDERAFNMWPTVGSKIIRTDLQEAGIPYKDRSGRVADFHALRHTFITNLANADVHPSVAQSLARHSSITLTMGTYTHVALESMATALDRLPNHETPLKGNQKAIRG